MTKDSPAEGSAPQYISSYVAKALDYQASKPVPLLASEYYILAEDYFVQVGNSSLVFPGIEDRTPVMQPFIEKPVLLNTACFNISKYLGREFTMEDFENINSVFGKFLEIFYSATKGSCALCASQAPNAREAEILLLCYPQPAVPDNKADAESTATQEVKSVFFALLWDMGFLTEQQLYDNGIMMGGQGNKIQAKKTTEDFKPKL